MLKNNYEILLENYGILLENYISIIYLLIVLLYNVIPFIGLIISLIGVLSLYRLKNEYKSETFLKIILVVFINVIIFTKLNIKSLPNVNNIVRVLLFLNIIVVAGVRSCKSRFQDILLRMLIVFTAFLTPHINFENTAGFMKKNILSVNAFVTIYTIVFTIQHMTNPNFTEHLDLTLSSLLISFMFHFISNKWLEMRALTLSIICVFDAFDIKNFMY